MKRTLLNKIEDEIQALSEQDVQGHVWWNKFKTFVEETSEHGEETETEIDLKKLTMNHDLYKFKNKK